MTEDIRALLSAEPFQPFVLSLTDQSSISIDGPKRLMIPAHGESVHYRPTRGGPTIIAVRHIVSVQVGEQGPLF